MCQFCGRIGHTAIKCYNLFDKNYKDEVPSQAFSFLHISYELGKEWYPHSGASAYVTSSTNALQSDTAYDGNDTVQVGDGTYLPITHIGSTVISSSKCTIPLNQVLAMTYRNPFSLSPSYAMIILVGLF